VHLSIPLIEFVAQELWIVNQKASFSIQPRKNLLWFWRTRRKKILNIIGFNITKLDPELVQNFILDVLSDTQYHGSVVEDVQITQELHTVQHEDVYRRKTGEITPASSEDVVIPPYGQSDDSEVRLVFEARRFPEITTIRRYKGPRNEAVVSLTGEADRKKMNLEFLLDDSTYLEAMSMSISAHHVADQVLRKFNLVERIINFFKDLGVTQTNRLVFADSRCRLVAYSKTTMHRHETEAVQLEALPAIFEEFSAKAGSELIYIQVPDLVGAAFYKQLDSLRKGS
jgi:hypothetical protein